MSYCDERPVYPVDDLPWVIPVGVQTSNGVEEIGFNVSAWLDKWPDMTFEVWPTRPTETAAYPAVCQLIGDVLVWYVSDADTAFEGLGTVEVVGIAEGIRKPSGPCTTEIKKTSLGATKEAPEGIKPYYEGMMQAAQNIREGLDGLNADLVGSDGYGGLYIVTCNGQKPNRTQAEIRAAVQARKTILLRAGTRVYTYFQETQSSNYDEAAAGKTCPTFVRPARQEDGGLRYYEVQVHEDDTITDRGKIGKTPNPNKLTFTGAAEATYDGSEEVTVEIPEGGGISDPGTAHQQLVSDADGKAVWADRLAYPYTGQVEVLPETALIDSGEGAFILSTSPTHELEIGTIATVSYNSTSYACEVAPYSEDGVTIGVMAGNFAIVGGEGGNADAPFLAIVLFTSKAAELGYGGIVVPADGATSVTISITQEGTAYKTIDEPYLPASAVRKPITLTVATDDTVTADTDFNAAWAMGAQALMDAIVIKKESADGIRTITPDNVELFENGEAGIQYIHIRYSSFYSDMADQSQIPDRGKWMLWHANALQIQSDILPGFNPMNLSISGTAQAGDYVRYEGNGLLKLVSIDQLKADLGLT